MNTELLIPLLTFGGTLLLVVTGLLNFSVFVRQFAPRGTSFETARRQLESARQQPQIQPVQRAMEIWSAPTERSGGGAFDSCSRRSKAVSRSACHRTPKSTLGNRHPYFYDNKAWVEGMWRASTT